MASRLERIQGTPKRNDVASDLDSQIEGMLRRFEVDEQHTVERRDHQITSERDIIMHFRVTRKACSCGWRGEWFRIRSTT